MIIWARKECGEDGWQERVEEMPTPHNVRQRQEDDVDDFKRTKLDKWLLNFIFLFVIFKIERMWLILLKMIFYFCTSWYRFQIGKALIVQSLSSNATFAKKVAFDRSDCLSQPVTRYVISGRVVGYHGRYSRHRDVCQDYVCDWVLVCLQFQHLTFDSSQKSTLGNVT